MRQSYAIALPKGATTLQTQFDLILEQMKGDGSLDKIAAAYNLNPLRPSTKEIENGLKGVQTRLRQSPG